MAGGVSTVLAWGFAAASGCGGFEAELFEFVGAPAVAGGFDVGAFVVALGGGELVFEVGDELACFDEFFDGFDPGVEEGSCLVFGGFDVEGCHGGWLPFGWWG